MLRLTVNYGKPTDPAEFDRHYADIHTPLVNKIPGLANFTAAHCGTLDGSEPPFYWVASLDFPDQETFTAGMSSPEMAAAGADVPNFASGGATMYTLDIPG